VVGLAYWLQESWTLAVVLPAGMTPEAIGAEGSVSPLIVELTIV
jgi:hypothetical protein